MDQHLKFIAEHTLAQLNKLGLIKDAQMNVTTINTVAGFIREYMDSQQLTITSSE